MYYDQIHVGTHSLFENVDLSHINILGKDLYFVVHLSVWKHFINSLRVLFDSWLLISDHTIPAFVGPSVWDRSFDTAFSEGLSCRRFLCTVSPKTYRFWSQVTRQNNTHSWSDCSGIVLRNMSPKYRSVVINTFILCNRLNGLHIHWLLIFYILYWQI